MFEKNYKNAMNNITVDEQARDKILDRIILKEELKERKNPAIPWRIAFACVACIAIVLGVIFVPRDNFKPAIKSDASKVLQVSKSYDEIYKLIKPKKNYNFFNNFEVTDDEAIIYEEDVEYVTGGTGAYNGGADMDGASNTNSAAKPGATSSENMNAQDNAFKNEADDDFSTTTEQVEGVAEADIVKTDGKYIYYLLGNELSIFKADGANSTLISKTVLKDEKYDNFGDMFLKDDKLILLQPNDYTRDCNFVTVVIYDISDPANPKEVATSRQEGRYNSSRMVGDYIYLISNCYINLSTIDKDDPATFVPETETNGVCEIVPADSIYRYQEEEYDNCYTVIGAFYYKDGALNDTASLLGGTDQIYCSQGNIILANTTYNRNDEEKETYSQNNTTVSRLEIKDGKIEYKTTGEVEGTLENQFFIDEHNGYFRFVTTATIATEKRQKFENTNSEIVSYSSETSARLTVLDSELKKTGEIKDLAKGERVYSVRFMGDTAYFVTFRQTDPLFSADLSDPKNPKILGELKIPGFSEYMYPYGDGLLLGFGMDADERTGRTTYLKLSMFNIADPANVTEDDKTIIDGYSWSQALENHKAMLVSPSKNLIGFPTYDPTYKSTEDSKYKYMIYEYSGDGFTQKAVLSIPWNSNEEFYYDSIRGVFIEDYFYVISAQSLQVFDIDTFLQIAATKF